MRSSLRSSLRSSASEAGTENNAVVAFHHPVDNWSDVLEHILRVIRVRTDPEPRLSQDRGKLRLCPFLADEPCVPEWKQKETWAEHRAGAPHVVECASLSLSLFLQLYILYIFLSVVIYFFLYFLYFFLFVFLSFFLPCFVSLFLHFFVSLLLPSFLLSLFSLSLFFNLFHSLSLSLSLALALALARSLSLSPHLSQDDSCVRCVSWQAAVAPEDFGFGRPAPEKFRAETLRNAERNRGNFSCRSGCFGRSALQTRAVAPPRTSCVRSRT